MKIYDISMNISSKMMVYKNIEKNRPNLVVQNDYSNSNFYESVLTLNLHTGTHIDSPLHMIEGGNKINSYPLDIFYTKCRVLDFSKLSEQITKLDLMTKNIEDNDFILLKTINSMTEDFKHDFVFLEKSGAKYLQEKKVIGVGIDSLGIERSQPDHETHKTLLANNIAILEGLRLKDVVEGIYTLIALPLKIDNAEASPTRAILIEQ